MTYEEAAAVPLGGLNALHYLRKAKVQNGERVLINGAGGSFGTFAVQLAKLMGAKVTAVDSTEKLDMLRALGIAVLAIYLILATLFRSYLQPLVVMSVVVFAFIGVSLGLFLTGGVLSMWVMYATVGLAGIVVNDSLVLMDFVNRERARGTPLLDSVRIGAGSRPGALRAALGSLPAS